jgi:hypothetical protein
MSPWCCAIEGGNRVGMNSENQSVKTQDRMMDLENQTTMPRPRRTEETHR